MNRLKRAASIAALACATLPEIAAAQSIYEVGRPMPDRSVHQPTYTVRDGVIAGIEIPAFGSGILHTYVAFTVRAPGNHSYAMLWTYGGPGAQFIPPIGSGCQIAFHYEADFAREADFSRPRMVVDEFDCDTGRAGQDRP
jgi:hypothetical protein